MWPRCGPVVERLGDRQPILYFRCFRPASPINCGATWHGSFQSEISSPVWMTSIGKQMANGSSARRDIVVIGGSAGSLDPLRTLVSELPANLAASILVVVHMPSHGPSILPEILRSAGPLPAMHPADGQQIQPGVIYVAPTDQHLLVDDGHLKVTRGPRENRHRPAIDPLFRTAA